MQILASSLAIRRSLGLVILLLSFSHQVEVNAYQRHKMGKLTIPETRVSKILNHKELETTKAAIVITIRKGEEHLQEQKSLQ